MYSSKDFNTDELEIKTLKYEIFGNKVFIFAKSKEIDSYDIFFNLLNEKKEFNYCVEMFIKDYIERNIPNLKNHFDYTFVLRNIIGSEETINKIRDIYNIHFRNFKIDSIIE